MTKVLDDVLAANQAYAANFGDKGNLPLLPAPLCDPDLYGCAGSIPLSLPG